MKASMLKRKQKLLLIVLMVFIMAMPMAAGARDVAPIVSTDWVQANLANPRLVVLDVRKVEEYKAGHIPGAVNVFYGTWAIKKGELLNELPATDDLIEIAGNAGIGNDSIVVVVGKMDAPTDRVDLTRVAWTLKYLGVDNVALLDGGQNKWVKDGKVLSTDAVKAKAKAFKGKLNRNLYVNKDYVKSRLGKATLIDVREPDFYAGKKKLPFVERMGHLPGAVNLPTSLAYNADGTFKSSAELAALTAGKIGNDKDKEFITYCDTGKFCTAWSFLMTELFGYKDVKVYDGSAQEWMKDLSLPAEM
jgi:thiosulfate/3-mercaptopyruvate sulfurtransferase